MSLRGLEKLKIALVLVPVPGEVAYNFDQIELGKLVREPQVQQGPMGPQIVSLRDQIVISLQPTISFQEQSDNIPPGPSRLPEIAAGFTAILERFGLSTYTAYGWNFEIAFDAPGDESAAKLITSVFVQEKTLLERANVKPIGAGVTLFFEQASARCMLKLEPRFSDLNTPRFWSTINYHYDLTLADGSNRPPGAEELRIAYNGLWGSYLDLIAKLVKP